MALDRPDPPTLMERARQTANVLTFVMQAIAHTVEVHLHHGFGPRYLDMPAAAAVPLLFFYNIFWEGFDSRPMLIFLGLYILRCLIIRLQLLLGKRRGPRQHSRYNGVSYLTRWFPKKDELTLKRDTEPNVVLFAGALAMLISVPLGFYLFSAAFALSYTVGLSVKYEEVRAQDMFDRYLDQQRVSERFRGMLDDDES